MKKHYFLWLVLLVSLSLSAQIKGVIVDESGKPIPYVNINIENENTWTNAEEDGVFSINANEDKNLIFSALGYEGKILKATASGRVVLKESPFRLDEVIIEKSKETKELEIGKSNNTKTTFISGGASWLNAKYFPYDTLYAKTKFIKNAILTTRSKVNGAMFKLRIFSLGKNGEPDVDLINEDIIVTVKSGKKKNKIDLSKYHLTFPKDGIFIAFETLLIAKNQYKTTYTIEGSSKVHHEIYYAPDLVCNLSADENTYHMSQGKWIKMHRWHNKETGRLKIFNSKVVEPMISLLLTN